MDGRVREEAGRGMTIVETDPGREDESDENIVLLLYLDRWQISVCSPFICSNLSFVNLIF